MRVRAELHLRLGRFSEAIRHGAHLADGRPSWPNEQDTRMLPKGASLIGEHAFRGQGVPDGFRFALGQAQDIMPQLELSQRTVGGATRLNWQGVPTARAYFRCGHGCAG